MSRLDIFQAYDYYNTIAASRSLTPEEEAYYQFCMENHETICSEETDDKDPIINEATKLYYLI